MQNEQPALAIAIDNIIDKQNVDALVRRFMIVRHTGERRERKRGRGTDTIAKLRLRLRIAWRMVNGKEEGGR